MPKNGIHPTDRHEGQRLRARRLMLGMSQAELGAAMGVASQQVQKYEKGMNRVCASRLQRLSELLRVPVEFFFEGAPNAQGLHHAQADAASLQYVSDYLATSDGLHLTKAFVRIPDSRVRRAIVKLVEEIAGCEDQCAGIVNGGRPRPDFA